MSVIDEARRKKSRAIAARDKGEFQQAEFIILEAEQKLRDALEPFEERRKAATSDETAQKPGVEEIKIREQLSHILGSKGGIYRRWKKHEESARAYDEGYVVEKWVLDHGKDNSYNLVQRLVARALIQPLAIKDNIEVLNLPLRNKLLEAKTEIERQRSPLGQRENDEYAAADLALVSLLLGDNEWELVLQKEFLKLDPAINDFIPKKALPSHYAVEVTLEVINDLRCTLEKRQDGLSHQSKDLARAADILKDYLQRPKQSGLGG